jgi:hypothetical protein
MKYLLLAIFLPITGCTNSFNALSSQFGARKGTPTVSVTMNDAETLPICSESSEGLSAFLAKEGALYRCQAGNWLAVGTQNRTWGFRAQAAVRYNQWEDLTTRKRWAIAPTLPDLASSCSKGWRLPLRNELVQASENGLFQGIKAHGGKAFGRAWTHELVDGKEEKTAINISGAKDGESDVGVYCVMDT